jgi:hypothetical protein
VATNAFFIDGVDLIRSWGILEQLGAASSNRATTSRQGCLRSQECYRPSSAALVMMTVLLFERLRLGQPIANQPELFWKYESGL